MVKLIWTDQAIDNLNEIGNFIAEGSEKFAKLTIKRLHNRVEVLKNFPKSGRVVPEKDDVNIRELIDGNYRIIYEVLSDHVIYILAVHHSARKINLWQ